MNTVLNLTSPIPIPGHENITITDISGDFKPGYAHVTIQVDGAQAFYRGDSSLRKALKNVTRSAGLKLSRREVADLEVFIFHTVKKRKEFMNYFLSFPKKNLTS